MTRGSRWGACAGAVAAVIAVAPAARAQDVRVDAAGGAEGDTSTSDAQVTSAEVAPAEQPAERANPTWMARRRLQIGARIGYAAGAGSVDSGLAVRDASNGTMPIMLDVGWRALPWLYVGAYGQLAPVFQKTNQTSCPSGFDCTAIDWRLGIEADFHYLPRSRFDPYVGIGAGYEILHNSVSGTTAVPGVPVAGAVDANVTDRGWEFAALTLGFDYRISDWLGVGPFASASIGDFNVHTGRTTVSVNGAPISSNPAPDVDHTTHEIFTVGVRGTLNP